MTDEPTKLNNGDKKTRPITKVEMNEIFKKAKTVKFRHVPQQLVSTHDRTALYDKDGKLYAEIVEYPDGEILYIDYRK